MQKADEELKFCQAMFAHYLRRVEDLGGDIDMQPTAPIERINRSSLRNDPDKLRREFEYFDGLRTREMQVTRLFNGDPDWLRYVSLRLDTEYSDDVMEVFTFEAEDICTVKRSGAGHVEVKALVYQDKAGLCNLTFQRWDYRSEAPLKESISIGERELPSLMKFLVAAFSKKFAPDRGMRLMLDELEASLETMEQDHRAEDIKREADVLAFVQGRSKDTNNPSAK